LVTLASGQTCGENLSDVIMTPGLMPKCNYALSNIAFQKSGREQKFGFFYLKTVFISLKRVSLFFTWADVY
jgi:hypothetical protein